MGYFATSNRARRKFGKLSPGQEPNAGYYQVQWIDRQGQPATQNFQASPRGLNGAIGFVRTLHRDANSTIRLVTKEQE